MAKKIHKIEPLPAPNGWIGSNRSLTKVAAYARVSTAKEEQVSSIEAQKDYYQKMITNKTEWSFAGLYVDEGVSGTSRGKRDAFNKMIADALSEKIDLILTKSISRFARNTLDTLTTVRKLKDSGVVIYFEKEDIWTNDSKGEFMLTLLSSLAQEESRSISENVKWSHRKRFSDGKYSVPYSVFLGYDKGENGKFVINDSEAIIVRKIYKMFLQGFTAHTIAKMLSQFKIPTPAKKTKWNPSTVNSVLTNVKYKGDALLQKHYNESFLTKKQVLNKGELPQYYVTDGHLPIVSRELFDYVQSLLSSRNKNFRNKYSGARLFSSKIICGDCGMFYGPKVWHSTTYADIVWQCNHLYKDECKCKAPRLYDFGLQVALNNLFLELLKKDVVKTVLKGVTQVVGDDIKRINKMKYRIKKLKSTNPCKFATDMEDWAVLVESVVVEVGGDLLFSFLGGTEIRIAHPTVTPRWK